MSKFSVRTHTSTALEVRIGDIHLAFSYNTLVGVEYKGTKYKTTTKYSATTSKHMTVLGYGGAIGLKQEELENLADKLIRGIYEE